MNRPHVKRDVSTSNILERTKELKMAPQVKYQLSKSNSKCEEKLIKGLT